MTDLNLADLRAKAEAATPGPWRDEENSVWGACNPDDTTSYGMGINLLDCRSSAPRWAKEPLDYEKAEANAAFIAAANPATVLALLDRITALEEQARAAEGRATDYRTVAINQGWNWNMCDAHGKEEYAKHRGAHVDACAMNAAEARARLLARGEGV